ncbi:cation:dicarboxylase symporter family transporter [Flavobacterium branchiarum]|uniref:Cation:dicarboxylate symporter family transporter n=1 Tax=Flavobacterium branchiarum TaxID=1114870 RepID=A0ABV5FRT9_9FLAO|nr:cation:dicarboxylase symporter family transporter [Flavobacterium branchiarum]MDN3673323.1 cation:dicarboxylase symporter family transporter [Flavobacterium branchiarum]
MENQHFINTAVSGKFVKNLASYVFAALLLGVFVGHYFPEKGISLDFLGTSFLYLIEPFIQPVIFLTIVIGVSGVGNLKKVRSIGLKAIAYFIIITTVAILLGVASALFIEPGKIKKNGIASFDIPAKISDTEFTNDWFNYLILNRPLILLLVAILFGILLSFSRHREQLVIKLEKVSQFLYKLLMYLFCLIPIAAFGGMAYSVSKFGINSLLPLSKLLATTYITMAFFLFVVLGLILRYYKISLWKLLIYMKEELLIVFGTSSSRTAFPLIVAKLEKAGCSKAVVGLCIPLGYSFNLAGACIFLPICTLFVAQLFEIPLSLEEIITIILVILVTSKVASGVPGSGFIALTITFTTLHTFPLEALVLLYSVDKFMNEARTITNFIGNAVGAIVISKFENDFIPNPEVDLSIKN